MADVLTNFYPTRHVDPNEPGLVAAYTFADGELAQFGRYINRAATGAVYDLTTRTGCPLVGQGGGLFAAGDAPNPNNYWSRTFIPVGGTDFAYTMEHEHTDPAAGGDRILAFNSAAHYIESRAAGTVRLSANGAATYSVTPYSLFGRGRYRADFLYDGTQQQLVINGVVADSDNVVAGVPAGTFGIGYYGNHTLTKVYSVRRTVAEARASYVREFARKVLWQWQPRDVGEGPVGGILTGSYSGVGGWTCPLGAATMGFVWRPDLSSPAGGRLALTDTQTVNLNRIDFEYGSRPWFGSWLIEAETRDPATDSLVVGWTPRRGVDPTAAGSNSYWMHLRTAAGPWWRASLYLANGAQIDAADAPFPGPAANERVKVLVTRDVDGSVQVWNYVQTPRNGWWWSTVAGNDVTVLSEACMTVAARGMYVSRVTAFQGSMTPHELEAVLP